MVFDRLCYKRTVNRVSRAGSRSVDIDFLQGDDLYVDFVAFYASNSYFFEIQKGRAGREASWKRNRGQLEDN